jgi:hypothetical protein
MVELSFFSSHITFNEQGSIFKERLHMRMEIVVQKDNVMSFHLGIFKIKINTLRYK